MAAPEERRSRLLKRLKAGRPGIRQRTAVELSAIFLITFCFFFVWMTGLTLKFQETEWFPNYNMLGKSFLKGQLSIEENPGVDTFVYQGKRYFYFGPAPALFHIPFLFFRGGGLPTGLAVVFLCAATCVIVAATLKLLPTNHLSSSGPSILPFVALFAFNGFMLFMVSIPSIHHEAIVCGTFFLLLSVYLILKAAKADYHLPLQDALIAGVALVLCIGSRFSHLLTVLFLLAFVFVGVVRQEPSVRRRNLVPFLVLCFTVAVGTALLFSYNHARFGSFFDFGLKNPESIFREYYLQGNYFRYDHVPHNFWSYFFEMPRLVPVPPYLALPFYLHKVIPVFGPRYFLMHANELAASVFVLLPITLFCFVPLVFRSKADESFQKLVYLILSAAFILQLTPLLLTVASNARYFHEFLPFLMMLAFLGIMRLKARSQVGTFLLATVGAISLVLSFSVVANALPAYEVFIGYRSPLLDIVARLMGSP